MYEKINKATFSEEFKIKHYIFNNKLRKYALTLNVNMMSLELTKYGVPLKFF